MDRAAALTRLPVAHAVAIELEQAGVDEATIADRLGISPASVRPLLSVAHAKLAHLLDDEDRDPGAS